VTGTDASFDYVVVGAGSAGCVLADRLSADGKFQVLVIEAGGSDRSILIQMPTALSIPMNMPRYNWGFETEPEPFLDGRRMDCPRGKVLGGSSSINGMVYVRGHARDFDEWEAAGATGWGYRYCLPYFRRAEGWVGGGDDYRGGDGPLGTCAGNEMTLSPLYGAFIEAGREAGYPLTEDYNGHRQEGFGPMHMTVKGGVRWSAANAYLKPALGRPNLHLVKHALVRRVVLEGRRAVGIEYEAGGRVVTARAGREVILAACAIGSPTILQLSGIGPADGLRQADVEPVHELDGVGANLQDHLEVYFQHRCKAPITLNGRLGLISKGLIGARWLLRKDGLGATNHFEACAFIRSAAGVEWPDIQYHFLPAAMRYDGRAAFDGHGFQVHVGPNKPRSRGRVAITSPDPRAAPAIRFNYLEDARDRADWRAAIRLTREILSQPALDPYRGDEIQPGTAGTSDDDIDAWVRAHAESAYHPSCTCKMGPEGDPMAVLDSDCRVRGMEALRVVDSSIFPTITNGNLNGPTIMAAEKAADAILGRAPAPPSNAPAWIDPEWQTRQRPGAPLRPLVSR
jgi:choline dehydrogenase